MPRVATTRTVLDENNLVDDVPAWMLGSAYTWIKRFTRETHRVRGTVVEERPARERIHAIERYIQINFPNDEDDAEEIYEAMMGYAHASPAQCLDIIEAIVATNNNVDLTVPTINAIFVESGSKWLAVKHDAGVPTLEERVDETTALAYEAAVASAPNGSSDLMKKAWGYAFGRNPDASEAYSYAVKAMEAAAWPIVTPNNNSATLGHILGELKANRATWHTKISEQQASLGVDMVVNAMQLVWEGHTDRHGSANPVAVTQEAAEQAVFTAVMVCNYCARGYLLV